jgi:hypothetical protein
MGLKKGQTNNVAGRPKGKANKVTTEMRTWLSGLIDKNRRQFESDLKRLEAKDRLIIIERLIAYCVPKLQAIDGRIDLNKLSDEQMDVIISELTKQIDSE